LGNVLKASRPYLIVPIETKVRELDAKLYFALCAVEAGYRVILGGQAPLFRKLALIPAGIYLDKSVARRKVRAFQRLRAMGFGILACCEEGLVYRNRDAYLNERVAPEAFSQLIKMFSWGDVQSQDIASVIPGAEKKLVNTGNPRFDLLRPELRGIYKPAADKLKDKFGNYILINTNFGRYNHYFGEEKLKQILRDRGLLADKSETNFYNSWIDYIGRIFNSFADVLPVLSNAFPDHTIVLRPHPSENHAVWKNIVKNLPNVRVLSEGQVIPWILGAELSIHNSCTTGLEAALLEKPVFVYRTLKSEIFDSFLPNRVSVESTTPESLIENISAALQGKYIAPLENDLLVRSDVERYVCSLSGPLATDRILEQIGKISLPASSRTSHISYRLRDHFVRSIEGVVRTIISPFRSTGGYAKQKFPGLSHDELTLLADKFIALTGRFSAVKIQAVGRDMFKLHSD
jgi:surface carbohydrate biosynthesis protein